MTPEPFELAVPVGATDHYLGPSQASVTVVEYGEERLRVRFYRTTSTGAVKT